MAAVFIPMMALVGYEAGFTQAAFRLGDSATQVLTPLNLLLVVVLGWLRKYEPNAGIGTFLTGCCPSPRFWILWVLVIAIFFFTGTGTRPRSPAPRPKSILVYHFPQPMQSQATHPLHRRLTEKCDRMSGWFPGDDAMNDECHGAGAGASR
ncbi:AbgT family transporter [Rhodococcus sp. NPDC057014]|uniref:AbgT family transporter n=1 Tax=Rhodococcus sp. NPDC057014 TaxID=3346000 RepID=UPI00363421E2